MSQRETFAVVQIKYQVMCNGDEVQECFERFMRKVFFMSDTLWSPLQYGLEGACDDRTVTWDKRVPASLHSKLIPN